MGGTDSAQESVSIESLYRNMEENSAFMHKNGYSCILGKEGKPERAGFRTGAERRVTLHGVVSADKRVGSAGRIAAVWAVGGAFQPLV